MPAPSLATEYPAIAPMEKAKGRDLRRQCSLQDGKQCYESGDGVVVSLVPGAGASCGERGSIASTASFAPST